MRKDLPLPTRNEILLDRYRIQQHLLEDSVSHFYLAQDEGLSGIQVTVRLLKHAFSPQNLDAQFANASKIAAILGYGSTHIVKLLNYGVYQNISPFWILEWSPQRTLATVTRRSSLPLAELLPIFQQICTGVAQAHQGIQFNEAQRLICHRDLKASQIYLSSNPEGGQFAKISGFGLYEFLNENASYRFFGTPSHSAPEQFRGEFGPLADIYSLGIMFYGCLARQHPLTTQKLTFAEWKIVHQQTQPAPLANKHLELAQVPQLCDLIMRCLAKLPEDRPQSATELATSFEKCLNLLRSPSKGTRRPTQQRQNSNPLPQELTQQIKQLQWPNQRPVAEIVFAYLLKTSAENIASLWTMVSSSSLTAYSVLQSKVMIIQQPYPLALWLTILADEYVIPRFLPCYLDPNDPNEQAILKALTKKGYPILLFPSEKSAKPRQILFGNVLDEDRGKITTLLEASANLTPMGLPEHGKCLLRDELARLKENFELNPH